MATQVSFKSMIMKIPSLALLCFIFFNLYLYFQAKSYESASIFRTSAVIFIFSMTLSAYFKSAFSDPGTIPSYFDFLSESETLKLSQEDFHSNLNPAYISFCNVCQRSRPARSHHCSSCKKCIRKRDHHCVWINNCVGLENHKFFIQLLFYGAITACLICCSCAEDLIKNFSHVDYWTLFAVIFTFSSCMGLIVMASVQIWMIFTNKVMYEVSGTRENIFDLGLEGNLKSLFGKISWKYFLPVGCGDIGKQSIRVLDVKGEVRNFRSLAIVGK